MDVQQYKLNEGAHAPNGVGQLYCIVGPCTGLATRRPTVSYGTYVHVLAAGYCEAHAKPLTTPAAVLESNYKHVSREWVLDFIRKVLDLLKDEGHEDRILQVEKHLRVTWSPWPPV